jgi:hypothetical protein
MADALPTFPATRPGGYDANLAWDEDTQAWSSDADYIRRDGSRHHAQLVAIAGDEIYYEERT